MNPDELHDILTNIWNDVANLVDNELAGHCETIEHRVAFRGDSEDMRPQWLIRLGEIEGETIDVEGFTPAHLMKRFMGFGLQMVRGRLSMQTGRRK